MKEIPEQGCVFRNGDIPSLGCLTQVITNIIGVAFAFLGAVTLLMLLWGAIKFITSSGDPKAVQSAQKTITFAIIGAVVVLSAYILVSIVAAAFGIPSPLERFTLYVSP